MQNTALIDLSTPVGVVSPLFWKENATPVSVQNAYRVLSSRAQSTIESDDLDDFAVAIATKRLLRGLVR